MIDAETEEIALALDDALADFENRLLALLDVLHQLDGRSISLLDVIPHFLAGAVVALEHAPVVRVEPELRNVLVIHLDNVFVTILENGYVRLDNPRAGAGVAQARPGIQPAYGGDRDIHVFHRTAQHFTHLAVVAQLDQLQMVTDDLPGDSAAAVAALELQ